MWSLAGNQAVDLPIQQLCAWDTHKWLCAWEARSRQASGPVLGRPIQPPWAGVSQAGGAALGPHHAVLGSEVLGLWVEQLVSAPKDPCTAFYSGLFF